jgi:regulatory protein
VEDPEVVMEAAAMFLAVRPRSVDETRRRLRHLGYADPLVDTVVDRLVGLGYLDDEQFARAWVESRDRARPRGESALRRELALKGIDRETARAVLGERAARVDPDQSAGAMTQDPEAPSADRIAAERLLDRRRSSLMREPDPRKRRHRAYALLARYGFDPDVCREVANLLEVDVAESS